MADSGQEAPPLPPISPSAYVNTTAAAEYVGSETCRDCHLEWHASYLKTAHSRSFSVVDADQEPPDGTFDHALSRRRFRVYRADGQLRHNELLLLADGGTLALADHSVQYACGSGRFARTYLTEIDGFLVESPITWFASLGAWNISPGYNQPLHTSFRRNITSECLHCHVGRAELPAMGESRFTIHERAIGCERCHGPGSLHAARHQQGTEGARGNGDLTIVHPGRLSRELAESICHQCHFTSATVAVVRGRRREDFRPGLKWTDFCVNYGYDQTHGEMTVTGHVEQLRLSRCYTADQTLTCLSCHDPHASPPPSEKVAYYRAACLKCHNDGDCGASPDERLRKNGNQCSGCHMPQSPTDVQHVALTHHRIGIHRQSGDPQPDNRVRELVPILDISHLSAADRKRTLGLANMRLYADYENDPISWPHRVRAAKEFAAPEVMALRDPAVAAAVTFLEGVKGDLAAAQQHAAEALASEHLDPANRIAVMAMLVRFCLQQNRSDEAAQWLTQLVEMRLDPSDWYLLAVCRQRQGDIEGAIAALEQVIKIDPSEPKAYATLASLRVQRGEAILAQPLVHKAKLLEENRPR